MKNRLVEKMRARRDLREFNRALQTASPSMRQELTTIASRNGFVR